MFEDMASTCIETSDLQDKIENKANEVYKVSEAQIKNTGEGP